MSTKVAFARATIAALTAVLLLALAAACGQGQEDEEPAPTATFAPVTAPDIFRIDFTQVEEVGKLIDRLGGGEILEEQVIFSDLTGNGELEAVVPISSGGSAGNVAYAVFAYDDGELTALLSVRPESGSVAVAVEGGVLKETQPLFGPEDPLCCPAQLQNTYYRWDGQELVVERQEVIDNPTAKP
jgi:hypothetical protein